MNTTHTKEHTKDADCKGHIDERDGVCRICGVMHAGVPCSECGGDGFHEEECALRGRGGRAMKIHVDTLQYQWSHGKTPRGRGNWRFDIFKGGERVSGEFGESAPLNVHYAEAKKWARKRAKELGADHVVVCS